MYVYVKDGKIRLRSEERLKHIRGCQEYKTNHKMTDRLIFEGGQIKIYEESNQYGEDINRYHLQKELKEEKRINQQLKAIAYNKIEEDMELKTKKKEASNYHKNIYLLKKMKWSQHLSWQENG